jgi:hypothetical protein
LSLIFVQHAFSLPMTLTSGHIGISMKKRVLDSWLSRQKIRLRATMEPDFRKHAKRQ